MINRTNFTTSDTIPDARGFPMVRLTNLFMVTVAWLAIVDDRIALAEPLGDANQAAVGKPDDFDLKSRPLFDGETLAGWEGNAYWFRVEPEENAIVAGRLDQSIPHNEFLCTTSTFGDFELRLDVKLVGEGKNAGVQIRSQRVPGETEVAGYQADAGWMSRNGRSVWGALYDESRRRKFLAEPDDQLPADLIHQDDWNAMRVICEGPRIQIFINGRQTIDYLEADDSIPQTGIIGLQIHSGKPAEAWYRNPRILSR